jgi:hypothetical protein
MEIIVDMSEKAARIGKLFLDMVAELASLKQQIDSGLDADGAARTHIGAFAMMLQDVGLEPILRDEFDMIRRPAGNGWITFP